MKKKVVAIFLCTALVLGSTVTAGATEPTQITSQNIESNIAQEATKDAYNAEVAADKAESAADNAKNALANAVKAADEYEGLKEDAEAKSNELVPKASEVATDSSEVAVQAADYEGKVDKIMKDADKACEEEAKALSQDITDKEKAVNYSDNLSKVRDVDLESSANALNDAVGSRDNVIAAINNHNGTTYTKDEKAAIVAEANKAQDAADIAAQNATDAAARVSAAEGDYAELAKLYENAKAQYDKIVAAAKADVNATEEEKAEIAKRIETAEANLATLNTELQNAQEALTEANDKMQAARDEADKAQEEADAAAAAASACEDILAQQVVKNQSYQGLRDAVKTAEREEAAAEADCQNAKAAQTRINGEQDAIISAANDEINRLDGVKKDAQNAQTTLSNEITSLKNNKSALEEKVVISNKTTRDIKEYKEVVDFELFGHVILSHKEPVYYTQNEIAAAAKYVKDQADKGITVDTLTADIAAKNTELEMQKGIASTAEKDRTKQNTIITNANEAKKAAAKAVADKQSIVEEKSSNTKTAKDKLAQVEDFIFTAPETEEYLTVPVEKLDAYKQLCIDLENSTEEFNIVDNDTTKYKDATKKVSFWDGFIGLFNGDTWSRWFSELKLEGKYHANDWFTGVDGTLYIFKNDEDNTEYLVALTESKVVIRSIDDIQLATFEASYAQRQAEEAAKKADAAVAKLQAAETELDTAQKNLDVSKSNLANAKKNLNKTPAQIAEFEDKASEAKKKLDDADAALTAAKNEAAETKENAENAQAAADEAKKLADGLKVKTPATPNPGPSNNGDNGTESGDDTTQIPDGTVALAARPTSQRGAQTTVTEEVKEEVKEEVIEEQEAPKADAPEVEEKSEEPMEELPLAPIDEVNKAFPWWIILLAVVVIGAAVTVTVIGTKKKNEVSDINLK